MEYRPTSERVPCVPLYAVTDPAHEVIEFIGTGTLLHFRGRHIIATAAHVIDRGKKFILLVAGPDVPLSLNGSAQVTPLRSGKTRQTDPLDFCAIDLTDKEVQALKTRCAFFDLDASGVWDVPPHPFPHMIMGYPEDANAADLGKGVLLANLLLVDTMEDRSIVKHAQDDDYRRHPSWYLGLRFDPRRVVPQKNRQKVSTLNCFSGGPVWRTTGRRVLGFAGLVTESPRPRRTGERLIYAMRASAIRDLLEGWGQRQTTPLSALVSAGSSPGPLTT